MPYKPKYSRQSQPFKHTELNNIQREPSQHYQKPIHKGIYLLPNSFTLAALFCGFYAIIQSMNGQFEKAAIAIFCSMILDGMDGRVARMTHTQSAFGEQFDSLADMVSFGVAPGLVMYQWHLKGLGKWGWLAAFIYVAGAAIRLARFNTNIKIVDKRYFQGLPSPASGALLASSVWLLESVESDYVKSYLHLLAFEPKHIQWFVFVMTIYAGMMMVSNLPFWSGKSLAFKKSPVWMLGVVALLFALIFSNPAEMFFGFFMLYSLSGVVLWCIKRLKNSDDDNINHTHTNINANINTNTNVIINK